MTNKSCFGRYCSEPVRLIFGGGVRTCSNPARRRIGGKFLCGNHLRGAFVKVTIEFELETLDGTAAAKLVMAVKRAIDFHPTSGMVTASSGGGPIVDTDGAVLGQWRAEATKKKKKT